MSDANRAVAGKTTAFFPGAVWPDTDGTHINAHGGGVYYEDGVYYWFGEYKTAGEEGNRANVGVSVYSSHDLINWMNEGIALHVVEDDPNHDIARGCILERPKVVRNPKTGKYVMWFHLELKGEGYAAARSGVAVADFVTGPYRFIESFRPNAQMARDMTLFIDEDGAAYHFFASEENQTMRISQLTDDYLRPGGKEQRVFIGRSMEAPAICKHAGKYWFIASDCTGWAPNPARSAVAENIWGPWTELGNPCLGDGAETTFESQSTYILPVAGRPGCFIFMADRWRPKDAIDGRYVWLPLEFESGRPVLRWRDSWDLSLFDQKSPPTKPASPVEVSVHSPRRRDGVRSPA
jgi:Glycosyl hydrolases family 43